MQRITMARTKQKNATLVSSPNRSLPEEIPVLHKRSITRLLACAKAMTHPARSETSEHAASMSAAQFDQVNADEDGVNSLEEFKDRRDARELSPAEYRP
jgi:hypothetical protein